jgi:hypothetical protein
MTTKVQKIKGLKVLAFGSVPPSIRKGKNSWVRSFCVLYSLKLTSHSRDKEWSSKPSHVSRIL